MNARLSRTAFRLAVPAALVLAWGLATAHPGTGRPFWPAPSRIVLAALDLNRGGFLWLALGASLLRDAAGFLAGASAGVLAGALLGLSTLAYRIGAPTLHVLKAVAVFAWIPLLTMVFGLGEPAKIAFIALSAFYPLAVNTLEGFRSVPEAQRDLARAYGLGPGQRLRKIFLPAALPSILTGAQVGLILAWHSTVAVEYFMSAGPSVGGILLNGAESFRLEIVFVGILLLGSVGLALNQAAHGLGRWLLRHRPRTLEA